MLQSVYQATKLSSALCISKSEFDLSQNLGLSVFANLNPVMTQSVRGISPHSYCSHLLWWYPKQDSYPPIVLRVVYPLCILYMYMEAGRPGGKHTSTTKHSSPPRPAPSCLFARLLQGCARNQISASCGFGSKVKDGWRTLTTEKKMKNIGLSRVLGFTLQATNCSQKD